MTISSLSDGDVNSALSVLIPRSPNFKYLSFRSSYSATDELSLCQDRITSIFSLIKRNFKKVENKLLEES